MRVPVSSSPVAQSAERPTLTRKVGGASPSGAARFSRRSPISRGTPLRPEPVRVRVLPPGLFMIAPALCSIGVSANTAACRAAAAGAAPAWSATISNGDHDVTAASGPVTAVVRVRIPLVTPISMDPKLRQRSIRLLTGRAGRTSLRVHHLPRHSGRAAQQYTNNRPIPCPTPASPIQPQ